MSMDMHLEAIIERVWRYTWRGWSSELRDALRDYDWASVEMHLDAVIMRTWRPELCEFGDTHGSRNCVHLEMLSKAMIKQVWWYTWTPWLCELGGLIKRVWRYTCMRWSSEFGETVGGHDWSSLEIHLQALIGRVWRCTSRLWSSDIGVVLGGCQSGCGSLGGRRIGSCDAIHWLIRNCGHVENSVTWFAERWETGWEWVTVDVGMIQSVVYAVLSICCTWC